MTMALSTTLSLCSNGNILFTHQNLRRNNTQIKKRPTTITTPKLNFSTYSNPQMRIAHLSKEKKKETLQRNLVEKAVGFVAGSVIFAGFFFGVSRKPAISIVPNQTESSETRQEEEEEEEEQEEEEAMYERLLEREPKNVEALKVVLHGKMRRGKTKEAVKVVERLADLEPEEVEWKLLKALCCELMGELSKAKSLFAEILKEKPLLLRALHGLALAMHKNGEGEAVFVMLNKSLEIARRKKRVTEERNIKILMAQMRVVRGELEEGLKGFQALVNEDYRDFRPYLCLGIIYSLQDKKKEADEQFEIYRSLVPEEFPQRSFLDDVVITAKTKSQEQLKQEFQDEYATSSK